MSMMLTLIEAGWDAVRAAAAQGRRTDALTRVTRLLARPNLPVSLAAEAHRLAGELHTEAEQYRKARRHLRAAAALEPAHAHTCYLQGLTYETDPHGCDRRAAVRFRRATKLEPGNNLYRAAFGRAAVRAGRSKVGVTALLEAAEKATGEIAVVRVVVDGLLAGGRVDSARQVLNQARFLGKGRELNALDERVRFEAARKTQREQGRTTRHRQDAEFARDGGRVVLPFIQVVAADDGRAEPHNTARLDVVSFPRPHFPRLRTGKAGR